MFGLGIGRRVCQHCVKLVLRSPRRLAGFTVIELLVSISIIAVLIAVLLPAVQASREAVRRVHCQTQQRQLGLALHNYHDNYLRFPAGSYVRGPSFSTMTGWGWGAMILPMIEQSPLYSQIDFSLGTAVGTNTAVIAKSLPLWRCPADTAPETMTILPIGRSSITIASGNYSGVGGLLHEMSSLSLSDVTDGASQTLLLGERVVDVSISGSLPYTAGWFGQLAYPDGYEYRSVPHMDALAAFPINRSLTGAQHFSSRHRGGAYFCLADGAVRFLSENIDGVLFQSLGTPAGGESVGEF